MQVYGPSIGFTADFGSWAKSLVGMHGIAIGIGEIVGGLLFGIFGHLMVNRGRDPIVILGFLVHVLAFFLVFINIPNDAPFGETSSHAYIKSSPYIAIVSSLLLGFGDACFNTQIFSILGVIYADNSASAFALFKFIQSSAAALAFFYSDHCPLYYQLLILTIFCVMGTTAFTKVELKAGQSRSSPPIASESINEDEHEELLASDEPSA